MSIQHRIWHFYFSSQYLSCNYLLPEYIAGKLIVAHENAINLEGFQNFAYKGYVYKECIIIYIRENTIFTLQLIKILEK